MIREPIEYNLCSAIISMAHEKGKKGTLCDIGWLRRIR
jgi:hypothetical protein